MKYSRITLYSSALLATTLIFVSCTKEEEPEKSPKEIMTFALTGDVRADSLKAFVTWMQNMGTRFSLADNRRTVAVKIRNRFIQLGYPDTKLDSFQIFRTWRDGLVYNQWQYNVISTLQGGTYPDSISIIGGHYDNILKSGGGDPFVTTYGANDNASGVAAALEVARVMKKNNYQPKSTIKFIAYGAEELGLLGSYDMSNKSNLNNEKIKMMLNNDMISYEPSADKRIWYVDIMDYDNSHDLRYQAEELLHKYTVLNHVNVNTYNKQSDSYPYSLKGYVALFFFANSSDPNYHTLNDIVANCNFDYCREVVNISVALLVDMN
jgi:leucyl aminopeptidase